jgi:hypothetical protein
MVVAGFEGFGGGVAPSPVGARAPVAVTLRASGQSRPDGLELYTAEPYPGLDRALVHVGCVGKTYWA